MYTDFKIIMKKEIHLSPLIVRFMAFILLLSLSLALLVACGGGDSPPWDICFTDALGREVKLSSRPKRVAALIGSFADVWLLSGGSLCAAAEDAWEDFGLSPEGAVNIGGAHSPSLELLLASAPDFVIASASTAANVKMREPLESAGITVAYFDVDSFSDYLSMLKICTDITGRADLYKKNGEDIAGQIEQIKLSLKEKEIPEEHKKILLLRAGAGKVKARGSQGTVLGELLSDMGCINIADSDSTILDNLSIESIIREQPYRIFTVTMGDEQSATDSLEELIYGNAAWSSLSAVREGRLHIMERELFNLKPNSRWAQAYRRIYEILAEE